MSPERWKQLEEVFQSALDLPEAERRGFIAGACVGDDTLREQVEALVAQYERAGDFIEAPAVVGFTGGPALNTTLDGVGEDPMNGRRIGSYRIVREAGRGGMGAVYLAERADSAFHKRVALKVVKRGMDTDFILRRFRHERQILASFDHPNIARLLDGGTTEEGLPYFVMEFIEGQPVYRFCDAQRLGLAERLRLFCQVCDAVAYAHQHLVVHRDLKPSNVLVTKEGIPKLLDFGIAKLLNPEMMPDTVTPTASAMRLMTPEYASPEQVQGFAVTPASDIYALGVLLYELLTGHRPYRFPNRSPHEVARVICEDEPEPPSRAVSQDAGLMPVETATGGAEATVEAACRARGTTTPDALRRALAGNLDNIIMKALRKEPGRRYPSVEEMREDIARHLEGRPISAPLYYAPTIRFPVRGADAGADENSIAVLPFKMLENRNSEDTGDEYLGVGLTDALVTRLSSLRRFTLRPTSSVMRYDEKDSDPIVAGRELAVSFVLDGRIRRVGNSIRVNAQLLDVREGTTIWAGQFDEMSTDVLHLEDNLSAQVAQALVPQLTGDERRQLAKRGTDNSEAFEAYLRGRYHWSTFTEEGFARALTCYHQAISFDPDYALAYAGIADYYNFLGVYGVMPFAECSAAAKEAATKAVALDGALAEAYSALGFAVVCHDFDWKTAEAYHLRALELNPNYATAHQWYSFHLQMEGRFVEAIEEARRALELDPFSPSVQQCMGWCYSMARRLDDALAAYRKLLAAEPRFAYGYITYSIALRQAGNYEEAVETARRGVEYGSGDSPFFLATLGEAYAAAGRVEEAKEVLSRLGEMAARRYVSPYHLALIHCHLGDKELALALLNEAHALLDGWLVWLGVEPQLDTLRSDPRFAELLRLTNNPLAGSATARTAADESPADAPPATPLPTENAEAYALYVAARYHERKRTAEGLREAIARYEHAIELDPRFAHALAGLSECYALLNWYVEPTPDGAWARAKRCALRAVELNEGLTEAHEALGFVLLYSERDHEGAEDCFRRAVTLDPSNSSARRWHALNLSAMGRHAEALAEIRLAQELRPASAVIATAAANILFFARRFDEATEQCRKALELDPGSVATHVVLRWSYEQRGLFDEAFAVYEKERAFAGDTPTMRVKLAHTLAAAGRGDGARAVLEELLAGSEREGVSPYEVAVAYSLLGEREEAFAWLSRSAREQAVGFTFVRVDPRLDRLRDDPRLAELLRRAKELHAPESEPHAAASSDPHTTGDALSGETHAAALVHETSPTEGMNVGGEVASEGESVDDGVAVVEGERAAGVEAFQGVVKGSTGASQRKAGLSVRALAALAVALACVASVAVFSFYLKNSNHSPGAGDAAVRPASEAVRGTQPSNPRDVRSVAVLPFTTAGASGDEQYLGVGLADAVSGKLGELNEVTTRPAIAVRRYLGAGKSPVEAGRELGADYVLAGTVTRTGERVMTSLELTDVAAGRVIWSERLDQRFTDIPTLQTSVSERVATALDIQLTSDERARIEKQTTRSSEAYALYLAGRYHLGKRTPEGLRQAITSFEKAVEADPSCAFAYSGLADSYALLNWYVEPPPADAFARAKDSALKSVALDDSLAEAHVSLAFVGFYYDRDLATAEREFRRAVSLNPTYAAAHHRFALVLAAAGRHEEALEEVRRAEQLDPRSAIISAAVANVLFYAQRYDEAVEQCRKALELDPGSVAAYTVMRWAYERRGMSKEALDAFERERAFAGDSPTTRLKRAQVLAVAGRGDESRSILKELVARREREWVSAYEVAVAYSLLGEREEAFAWLSRSAREHAVGFAFAAVDPLLDFLRSDTRFAEALRAGGINE